MTEIKTYNLFNNKEGIVAKVLWFESDDLNRFVGIIIDHPDNSNYQMLLFKDEDDLQENFTKLSDTIDVEFTKFGEV